MGAAFPASGSRRDGTVPRRGVDIPLGEIDVPTLLATEERFPMTEEGLPASFPARDVHVPRRGGRGEGGDVHGLRRDVRAPR
jgi:hypothetical protein